MSRDRVYIQNVQLISHNPYIKGWVANPKRIKKYFRVPLLHMGQRRAKKCTVIQKLRGARLFGHPVHSEHSVEKARFYF